MWNGECILFYSSYRNYERILIWKQTRIIKMAIGYPVGNCYSYMLLLNKIKWTQSQLPGK